MDRELINYVEFIELMEREENSELSFEKVLDHLSNNMLYVTKNQLNDIYRLLYIKIKLHNIADGPSIFKKESIKLYNIEYDFDEEDALFTISIALDYEVVRTIYIGATIQKESVNDIDSFVTQYDNLLAKKTTLIDFIKFTNGKIYSFHKAFQDILLSDMEELVSYFNTNYEQQFVYDTNLDEENKYIVFYEIKNSKIIKSYYFQWELEK